MVDHDTRKDLMLCAAWGGHFLQQGKQLSLVCREPGSARRSSRKGRPSPSGSYTSGSSVSYSTSDSEASGKRKEERRLKGVVCGWTVMSAGLKCLEPRAMLGRSMSGSCLFGSLTIVQGK